jgi:hypothetical protein
MASDYSAGRIRSIITVPSSAECKKLSYSKICSEFNKFTVDWNVTEFLIRQSILHILLFSSSPNKRGVVSKRKRILKRHSFANKTEDKRELRGARKRETECYRTRNNGTTLRQGQTPHLFFDSDVLQRLKTPL